MKSFRQLYELAADAGMTQTGEVPPLSGKPNANDGTEQKDAMNPNQETDNLIDALKSIINVAQQALEKGKSEEEEPKDDKTDNLVQRPGADGIEDTFGQDQQP